MNEVDVNFLAEFFGKDIRTVQLWAKIEGMPKEDRGKYDLIKCARWRIQKLEEDIEKLKLGDETLYQLQREYQKLRNEEKALDIEVKKRNLLDREQVELVNSAFIKLMLQNIKAIGPRITKKIGGDARTLQVINDEIALLLESIANTPIKYFEEHLKSEEKVDDENEFEE